DSGASDSGASDSDSGGADHPRPAHTPAPDPQPPAAGVPAAAARTAQPPVNGHEAALPGVAAAGAAAGAAAREGTVAPRNPAPGAPSPSPAPVPAQRAHAAAPAVPFPAGRQEAPNVEFQAPPPMPPLPRRSTRESELLTAAREVERWRGQPSASRISRELNIGMALATSLANALRDEEGLAPDEPL
ncbi:hypothetical protein KGA66_27870, partial [Actinocrinis puniceicyclus]|nr:hypothetical protein [Actinocrinis puniceicyclus]